MSITIGLIAGYISVAWYVYISLVLSSRAIAWSPASKALVALLWLPLVLAALVN